MLFKEIELALGINSYYTKSALQDLHPYNIKVVTPFSKSFYRIDLFEICHLQNVWFHTIVQYLKYHLFFHSTEGNLFQKQNLFALNLYVT